MASWPDLSLNDHGLYFKSKSMCDSGDSGGGRGRAGGRSRSRGALTVQMVYKTRLVLAWTFSPADLVLGGSGETHGQGLLLAPVLTCQADPPVPRYVFNLLTPALSM